MFNKNFYPTPVNVIEMMLDGHNIQDKTILEPSAGKGDIVDYLLSNGAANVIACENNEYLRKILTTKCQLVGEDFLKLTSDKISHVDYIIMNPPFDKGDKHILHAWSIAPAGCKIIGLCNLETVEKKSYRSREELTTIIDSYGNYQDLGSCFSTAERKSEVEVAMLTLVKPGAQANAEFAGFFMEDDQPEEQANGIVPYNAIRDLVNRYVEAIKIYDKQLETGVTLNLLIGTFFNDEIGFQCTKERYQLDRNQFKKDLQKSGWAFIFDKLDMKKYATRGLKEDINTFIEKQEKVPFTMRNIYRMLEIIVGTQSQRMDKAILEVFDKLTQHYHENRFNVEGWKTNSHYLMGEKFILPNMCYQDQRWNKGKSKISTNFGSYFELIDDMLKALCYLTGDNYDEFVSLDHFIRYEYRLMENGKIIECESQYSYAETKMRELKAKGREVKIICLQPEYGKWFDWGYFEIKAFKKGTMHFKFKDADLWGRFNQKIAQLKGYPLYEAVKTKETPKREAETAKRYRPTVLATIKLKVA